MKIEVAHDVKGMVVGILSGLFNGGECCVFRIWIVDVEKKGGRTIEKFKGYEASIERR